MLSAGVRKTIQQIKEIVGNHSDADIYVTLKETNMDPNETAQKLLYQGRSPLSLILSLPTLILFPSRPYLFAGGAALIYLAFLLILFIFFLQSLSYVLC